MLIGFACLERHGILPAVLVDQVNPFAILKVHAAL